MKKIILIAIAFIGINLEINAQFQGNFVQFFNNETYLNPAFAGTQVSALNLSAITRADYVGIVQGNMIGASKALITIDKRFDNKNFGLAANLNTIKFGNYNNYDLALNYSYHLNLGKDRKLCMGLKAGGIYKTLTDNLSIKDQVDDVFDPTMVAGSTFEGVIGAGFAYESEKAYLGVASPQVIGDLKLTASGGYKFPVNEDLYIEPNFLIRHVKGYTPKIDINTILAKNESFWVGANYSYNNSFAVMAGIYYKGRLKIGYAFDYNTNLLSGTISHEIMLQWDLEDAL